MARIPLRNYNREIESLIDQGATNEAVAHCQHILKTYPKHIETYRLLGKAYLEGRRFDDAVDIFKRVLINVPDDFVSHVGMSIINDEQNKLDDAIWHMERAFETQPSNPAIQGELQRLYGRRDGMEPPKIRMTRGALATMYVQGELYPQAIAEARAVLTQDPKRADMQVLLARAYFKSGQKSEAINTCAQLLKVSAHCLDANRILAELNTTVPNVDNPQTCRARVTELDPYASHTKGSLFQTNEVGENAVSLDKHEYAGDEQQSWNSAPALGTGVAAAFASSSPASQEQPDWLKSGGFNTDASASSSPDLFPASSSGDDVPDFLKQAGFGLASEPEQPSSIFDPEPLGDLAPAQMPDWLKGQAPTEAAQASAPTQTDSVLDTPDWLSGLGGAPALDSMDTASTSVQSSNVPDWLSGASAASSAPEPAQTTETPDWLSGLGGIASPEPVADSAPAQSGNVPDWLSGLGGESTSAPAQPAASVESLGATASEQDDAVAWLESLAAKHGAKPEELVTDPNKRNETAPTWVQQASNTSTPAQPATSVESLGATASEQDDAVAWLESLAAKHGAKPEELVTDPNKRNETAPSWVQQASVANEPQPAAESNDISDWLSNLDNAPASQQQPAQPAGIPDWLASASAEPEPAKEQWSSDAKNIGEQFFAEFEEPAKPTASVESLGATTSEQDDAVAWLESLAAKHGAKPEELVTDPNRRSETAPTWVQQASVANESQPATESNDIGNWLSNLDNAPASQQQPAQPAGIPDWLASASAEPEPAKEQWSSDAKNIGEQFFAEFEDPAKPAASVESLGATASEQDDAVAWLESLAAKHGAKPEELVTDPNRRSETAPTWVQQASVANESQPAAESNDIGDWLSNLDNAPASQQQPAQSANIPDWLASAEPEPAKEQRSSSAQNIGEQFFAEFEEPATPAASVESLGTTASEQDDAVAWLESLAAKHGAKPEELVTDPNRRSNTAPTWVQQASVIQEQPKPEPEPVKEEWSSSAQNIGEQFFAEFEEPAKPAASVESLGATASEQDDAVAWLESLAAKHGAKPEELVTDPNKRSETAPTWVQQASAIQEEKPAETDLPDWMSGVDNETAQAESELDTQNLAKGDLANWLGDLDDESKASPEKSAALPDWSVDDNAQERVEEKLWDKAVPESAKAESNFPDWLTQDGAESDADAVEDEAWKNPVPASPVTNKYSSLALSADLPDWLDDDEEKPEDAAPWDKREKWEAEPPTAPKPTSPSDWQPVVQPASKPNLAARPPRPAPKQSAAPVKSSEPTYESIDSEWTTTPEKPAEKPAIEPLYKRPEPVAKKPVAPAPVQPKPAPATRLPEPVMEDAPAPQPFVEREAPKPKKSASKQPVEVKGPAAVEQAKGELDRGDIPTALEHYGKLIKKGKNLDETIRDLRESLYRYPVEVGIWQTLGDAYMRSNRLKEALEAYNKAGELIR